MASKVSGVQTSGMHRIGGNRSGSICQDYLSVADFYADRSIFVTGGTGFMGKVLVEKLLRSCPKIKNIFLLIRPKRGSDVTSRLKELINSPLFEKLRKERPLEVNKIVPILGDITEPELGISEADQEMLCQKVSVVFHSAATVKFDEKLKLSVTINMLGTQQIVKLCHRMVGLEALVHVSTAYCNCARSSVCERVYAPPAPPDQIVQMVQWMPESLIDAITPNLIGNLPNTYTFTKALAEDMLKKECGDLPVAIVRPSIVLASIKEPLVGWVDNLNGPNGIVAATGRGFFRTMLCDKKKIADLVPVDIVINLMIVAAWNTAGHRGEGIAVYNCCTGQQNPITWGKFVDTSLLNMRKNPFILPNDWTWYPTGNVVTSRLLHNTMAMLLHTLPAHLIDGVAKLRGSKPIMCKVQQKLKKAADCLEYFTMNEWIFKDDNVQALSTSLSEHDRKIFDFDVRNLDWDEYMEAYVLGIRRYLFKESPLTLPSSRKHVHRLYIIHSLVQLVCVLFTWRFIYSRSTRLRDLCRRFLSYFASIARMFAIAT